MNAFRIIIFSFVMGQLGVHRIFLLIISLIKTSESTKLLAEFKKCGDMECETLLSRAVAIRNYEGPDCQYLNFKMGEEISVYAKLSGEREDLWAGSKGKDFGYFPKDAIQIEEVFISEEVQVPTKESDFICLHEMNYVFENEENILYSDNEEIDHLDVEENQESNIDESEFQRTLEIYLTPENIEINNQFPTTEAPENIRGTDKSEVWGKVEPESLTERDINQESPSHVAKVDPPSSSWVARWFGLESEEVEEETFKLDPELQEKNSFLSRKITVSDENELKELNIEHSLQKYESEPTSEFEPCPPEQPTPESELEEVPDHQTSAWFDDDFTRYFGFDQGDARFKLPSRENTSLLQDIPVPSDQEPIVAHTEKLPAVEEPKTSDNPAFQSSWFDLGFGNILYFAYAEEEQVKTDKQLREGSSGGNEDEHFSSSDFDLDNNEEREIEETWEIKDYKDKKRVLQESRDSDTLPYLDNADNPWNSHNIPKKIKPSFPQNFWDQDKPLVTDKTEELSDENQIIENMEVRSKNENSQSDSKMKYKEESQWQQEEKSASSTFERNSAKADVHESQIPEYSPQTEPYDFHISAKKVNVLFIFLYITN